MIDSNSIEIRMDEQANKSFPIFSFQILSLSSHFSLWADSKTAFGINNFEKYSFFGSWNSTCKNDRSCFVRINLIRFFVISLQNSR
jgi:hypothetical protein